MWGGQLRVCRTCFVVQRVLLWLHAPGWGKRRHTVKFFTKIFRVDCFFLFHAQAASNFRA